jgi:hypothetical protein
MASTYVNDLRLNEMATGDASGSWGTVTNTNLELIGEAFSYGTETIGDADSTLTIADGAADAARSFYLKITSSVDLTTTRIVTLGPNTVSKVWMIENATTGSQVITIKQGSGATINVPNGQVKMISTDGAGSGGAVLDLLVDVDLTGTTTAVNLDVSGTALVTGVLTTTAATVSNGGGQFNGAINVGVDDTGYDVKFFGATTGKSLLWDESADSLIVTGTTTLVGTTNLDAVDIDGATQIDATVTVGVDDTGYDVKFFGATAGAYMLWDESADDLILGGAAGLSVNSAALVTGVLTANGGAVFNESGADVDFRVESATTANALFVQGSDGFVGIGTSSPSAKLDVNGAIFVSPDTAGKNTFQLTTNASNDARLKMLSDTTEKVDIQANGNSYFNGGNVGIGTSSIASGGAGTTNLNVHTPSATSVYLKLSNTGTGNTASDGFDLSADSSGNAYIINRENAPLLFFTNNTERMRIDSSGNVGIGVVPPTDAHATWSQLFLGEKGSYISEKSNSGGIYGNFVTDNLYIDADTGAFANITTDQSSAYRQEAGVHHWYSQASGSAGAAVTLSEKMTIDSSGNVGIGTSSPAAGLHIDNPSDGAITAILDTDNTAVKLVFRNNTETGNNVQIGADGSSLVALTNATERMRIDGIGAVTMPYQPAFSVNKGGTAQEDIAIGTDVTITFDTERFDNNADFDLGANSFTAPVTGKYMLSLNIRLDNVDSAADYYIPMIITSNALYRFIFDPDFGQDANYWNVAFSVLADMDASDTAYVAYNQGGGTAQTDVSGDDDYTFFTGYLAC